MTCQSLDSVQALFKCSRIQLCMPCGGVQSTFSVLEASEVKFPALRGFVLPTDIHVSRGTRLTQSILSEYAENIHFTCGAYPFPQKCYRNFCNFLHPIIKGRHQKKLLLEVSCNWVSLKRTNRLFTSTRVAISGGAVVTNLNAVTCSVALVFAEVACRKCKLAF